MGNIKEGKVIICNKCNREFKFYKKGRPPATCYRCKAGIIEVEVAKQVPVTAQDILLSSEFDYKPLNL